MRQQPQHANKRGARRLFLLESPPRRQQMTVTTRSPITTTATPPPPPPLQSSLHDEATAATDWCQRFASPQRRPPTTKTRRFRWTVPPLAFVLLVCSTSCWRETHAIAPGATTHDATIRRRLGWTTTGAAEAAVFLAGERRVDVRTLKTTQQEHGKDDRGRVGLDEMVEHEFENDDDDDDDDDESLLEETEEVVEEIVTMFSGGDNTTVEEVMEEVESILGVTTGSEEENESSAAVAKEEDEEATNAPDAEDVDDDDDEEELETSPEASPTVSQTLEPTSPKESFDQEEGETEGDDTFNGEEPQHYTNRPVSGASASTAATTTTTPTSFTIFATLLGVFAMIFTAWQMSDNPDGLFASLCRLIITSLQLIVRVLCSPCRKCMPCCFSSGGHGYHEPYGHMPVSTMDYGYKDPALELS